MEGLIWGGATAKVVINKSIGLVVIKPRSLLSALVIFWKIFLTFCALYTISLFLAVESSALALIFSSMIIRWFLKLILVGIALPQPLFKRLSSYSSFSWKGHLLIGPRSFANSFNRFVGWEIWMILLNLSLCWSFWIIIDLLGKSLVLSNCGICTSIFSLHIPWIHSGRLAHLVWYDQNVLDILSIPHRSRTFGRE